MVEGVWTLSVMIPSAGQRIRAQSISAHVPRKEKQRQKPIPFPSIKNKDNGREEGDGIEKVHFPWVDISLFGKQHTRGWGERMCLC
jgi:hypothetical protein